MKLCINCKHYYSMYDGVFSPEIPVCKQEDLHSLIDGKQQYRRCSFMRSKDGPCKPAGILFEQNDK